MGKLWKCKVCGETNYTRDFCTTCDSNFWRFQWRRGWIQVWTSGVILAVVGITLRNLIGWPHWIIWGAGMACLGLAIAISVSLGKKFVRKKFTQIQE